MNAAKKSLAVGASALSLVAAAVAPAFGSQQVRSTLIPTPQLTVTASNPSTFTVAGPHHFSVGRVALTLKAVKGEQEIAVMRLHKGYTLNDLETDFGTFGASENQPTPEGLAALNRIVKRTTFYGGLDTGTGHRTVSGSVLLPAPGTYYLLNDSNGPGQGGAVTLTVTARTGNRAAPAIAATETATTAKRFTGPVNLPASGTIAFHNASTNSPHFMFLQHVKAGTTRKQVIKSLQSNGPGPELPGAVGTDVLFMGHTQTLSYTLPAGDYAQLCFFPDLKTGMPHAFMGMVRIVHLH